MNRLCSLIVMIVVVSATALAEDWPQWRGPKRDGSCGEVPAKMLEAKPLWRRPMTGKCASGIAVAAGRLVVLDYGSGKDFVRSYSADKGETAWTHSYDNAVEMQYTAMPRATPLIADGLVYTLSATGLLYCLKLDSGQVVWHADIAKVFGAKVPEYGYCASPIIVDGKLIIAPGGPEAAIVALDPKTGMPAWKTPGSRAAYASFIAATFGGVKQIVNYAVDSLGGWDPATGKRLWKLVPPVNGDFNVGTPLAVDGKLVVSTENNRTRLYGFSDGGAIIDKPLAVNEDLFMDMGTPTAIGGLIFGTGSGLVCIDAKDLKTCWISDEDASPRGFSKIIAGNGHIMIFCENGTMFLAAADRAKPRIIGSVSLSKDTWSHPAISNGRLYVRDDKLLYCYAIGK